MRKGDSPKLLYLARLFQSIPPIYFSWIDYLIPKKNKNNKYPIIFILAIPRGGSTIAYQLLNRGTNSFYLSNLWNLLFSIPLLGGKLVSVTSENKIFKSDKGLVSGLSGESEGMKFWEYWTGQGLEEKRNVVPARRLSYIKSVFSTLLSKKTPMISGYLGHSFSVEQLRKDFPGCIFVYVKRDKLSNVYSLVKTYNEFAIRDNNFNWISLKPKGWGDRVNDEINDKALWQFNAIKNEIESNISDKDTITFNYKNICRDPDKFIRDVSTFALQKNMMLKLNAANIPNKLIPSIINSEENDLTREIAGLLKNE